MGVKYQRARQTAWRTIADETVLLDLEQKRMYGLNPAGAIIWQALDEAEDLDQLRRMTVETGRPAFGEPEVAAFLNELLTLGLVEERELTAADNSQRDDARRDDASGTAGPPADLDLEALEVPAIAWREDVEQIAGTCAFFPSQNPLCNQVPFS